MDYKQQEANLSSNCTFIIGYYEGMLKSVLAEINEGNAEYITKHIGPLIEKTLNKCNEVWENRYEKHYSEIIKL